MSVRRLDPNQPESFDFTPENLAWAEAQMRKYPEGKQRAAVIPILWRAQEQFDGWLPEPAIRTVADMLGMPYIRALEIATFYTMFNLSPVGRYHVQLCGTTPCMLCGSEEIAAVCREKIGPQGEVSADGLFSWVEVECLGACVNAPMVQINKDYFEDLSAESFASLLDDLREGRAVTPGPQNGRQCAAPASGLTTLIDPGLYVARNPEPMPEPPAEPEAEASASAEEQRAALEAETAVPAPEAETVSAPASAPEASAAAEPEPGASEQAAGEDKTDQGAAPSTDDGAQDEETA